MFSGIWTKRNIFCNSLDKKIWSYLTSDGVKSSYDYDVFMHYFTFETLILK